MLVPNVNFRDTRVMGYGFAIAPSQQRNNFVSMGLAVAEIMQGQPVGCRQPMDVPLKGAGMGLVKIVDIKKYVPIGRSKKPKVGKVSVAAKLYMNARVFAVVCQIMGHQEC